MLFSGALLESCDLRYYGEMEAEVFQAGERLVLWLGKHPPLPPLLHPSRTITNSTNLLFWYQELNSELVLARQALYKVFLSRFIFFLLRFFKIYSKPGKSRGERGIQKK